MQDTELFLSLAEIAGVFVGFGALIAVRNAGPANAVEVASIGMVVAIATVVVAVSFAPVVLSRFDLTGHGLWLSCSLFALVLFWGGMAAVERMPGEMQAFMEARAPLKARARVELLNAVTWLPATAALLLVVLGVLPELESALYLAAIVLFLLSDALFLLMIVFRVGLPTGARPSPEEGASPPGSAA